MSVNSVVVLSAVRSAVGTFSGSLSSIEPAELAGQVLTQGIAASGVEADKYESIIMGNTIPTESRFPYVARVASIQAGMSLNSTAMALNRLCSSGLQAVVSSAQGIMLGDHELAIGGGVENMSRGGYLSPAMRAGARMGDSSMIDMMVATLTDPFGVGHMGITAENLASKWDISREQQDAFAAMSHARAHAAIEAGYFTSQIVPVELKSRKGSTFFEVDEHVKPGTTAESLAGMRPAFKKDGSVTAGNASGINDGASFLTLASENYANSNNLAPIARIVSYAVAGVPNDVMGEGPIPASKAALIKAGLTIAQMDVVESNEAFAAQALTVAKGLDLDPAKTNPNGGAIALGHPIGASGAVIATKAIHELHRTGGKYALVTMCIGGGQGIAVIFERL
ncbi:beta-ketothiolase BktB [Brumicola nitratireducens]|uniref:Beta-ketothiolase n=1 Tax=Glaciecola nitratireducens (strain JCM 12485 / KCTC 12276 / FR1064) TaxID=1085623 RepID=G4QF40_GLANF|nr:beta-ketothiolase BktB [Glaciecola nitratireducens]AEP28384.1 beta-ketothiolase [Glaciecola nitratireducens FR1064]